MNAKNYLDTLHGRCVAMALVQLISYATIAACMLNHAGDRVAKERKGCARQRR